MMRRYSAALLVLVASAGCMLGPDYSRPYLTTPPSFRDAPEETASIADMPWWEVFRDETLQALVRESLESSRALDAAIADMERARGLAAAQRGELFPTFGTIGNAAREKKASLGALDPQADFDDERSTYAGALAVAWEADVWGRLRRASEASRADLLASDAVRRGVVLSLVTGIAQSYLELRELDLELEISQRTVRSFQATYELFDRQFRGGVTSKLDALRAEGALAQAAATVPLVEQRIRAKENEIAVLLGRPPGPIERGPVLLALALPPQIPAGVPSLLLQRRPDLIEAEQNLMAATARVGVAYTSFFPRIGLSAFYGSLSSDLSDFLGAGTKAWSRSGTVGGPIFSFGRNYYTWEAAKAANEGAVAVYQQTVLTALADVSNALTAREKVTLQRQNLERQVRALQEASTFAEKRYVGGLATYLEVLDAQQQLFPAELALAQTLRDERLVVVNLYRALGGGWNQAGDAPTVPNALKP